MYSVVTSNTRYFIRRKAKQINTGNSDAKPSPGNTLRKNKQTIICLNAGKIILDFRFRLKKKSGFVLLSLYIMIIVNVLLRKICYSQHSHTSEIHYTGIETHGDGHLERHPPPPPTTVHLYDEGRGESPENRWWEGFGRR